MAGTRDKKLPHHHGAAAEKLDQLVERRKKRGREAGDGLGVDVGIGSVGKKLEAILATSKRDKLAAHMRKHASAAMSPITSMALKQGDADFAAFMIDVGPNMIRTIIEFLEEDTED